MQAMMTDKDRTGSKWLSLVFLLPLMQFALPHLFEERTDLCRWLAKLLMGCSIMLVIIPLIMNTRIWWEFGRTKTDLLDVQGLWALSKIALLTLVIPFGIAIVSFQEFLRQAGAPVSFDVHFSLVLFLLLCLPCALLGIVYLVGFLMRDRRGA